MPRAAALMLSALRVETRSTTRWSNSDDDRKTDYCNGAGRSSQPILEIGGGSRPHSAFSNQQPARNNRNGRKGDLLHLLVCFLASFAVNRFGYTDCCMLSRNCNHPH